MVVDAFRADFLFGPESQMTNLREMIRNEKVNWLINCVLIISFKTFSYIATAQAPTVTLPRIKVKSSHPIIFKKISF